jgi:LysR family hydrogen peroxide-inducible transcriptional activator
MRPLVEKYPHLHLEIHEVTTNQLVKDLREGKLDVGILSTPISATDLETEILYVEDLRLYGYLPSGETRISHSSLSNQRIFLLQDGHCLRDQIIQLCDLKKLKSLPSNLSVESNTFDTLLNIVDTFQGMTLLPSLYVKQLSEGRKKHLLEIYDGSLKREVSICYYRPYAKWNIIRRLQTEIAELVKPHLI